MSIVFPQSPSVSVTHTKIGSGTYGDVYYNKDSQTVCKYSKLIKTSSHVYFIDSVLREACFYKLLQAAKQNTSLHLPHDATVSYFVSPSPHINEATTSLLYDSPPNPSSTFVLFDMKHGGKPLHFFSFTNKYTALHLFKQCFDALAWLHKSGISHGDIKPANILVNSDLHVTLIDFGSICFHHDDDTHMKPVRLKHQRCTLYYVSPEECISQTASPASDMWSIGVTLFEHVTGKHFLTTLLQFCREPNSMIEEFAKNVNAKSKRTFDPTTYIRGVLSRVQYANLLAMLSRMIRDRDLLSIISSCLVFDVKLRAKAEDLVPLCESYMQKIIPHVSTSTTTQSYSRSNPHPLLATIPKSTYEERSHAGVDYNIRRQIITQFIDIASKMEDGTSYLPHAIMLFDRFTYRTSSNDIRYPHELFVSLSMHVTKCMLRQIALSITDVKEHAMSQYIDSVEWTQLILMFLEHMDMKCFNIAPSMPSTQSCTSDIWLRRFISKCMEYPLTHATLEAFSNL